MPDDKSDDQNRSSNTDNIISKLFGLPTDANKTTTTLKPIVVSKKIKKYDSTQTIVEESTEEIDKLRHQLEQEDCRGEGASRLRRGMQKISTSSKNILEKRKHVFGKKSKRNYRQPIDSNEDESSSLMGSAQEIYRVSPSSSLRNSLTDIRGKLKILTPSKPKKYQRAKSDGVAMAALLVRSMMVAPTALDCIDEANDSPKLSIKSQSIDPIKSGSMSNISGNVDENIYLKPTMAYTAAHLKISDSNLSSNFSESSCTSISTASSGNGDEEDCSESEETTQNDILLVDADTVSMVVKSVLAHEQSERNKDDWIEPSKIYEQQQQQQQQYLKCGDEIKMSMPNNKRDSIDGEVDPDMLKALMISPNDDEDAANWIQPGSTTDEPECLPEKRRGSVFHELKENISEKIHHLQEHMHLPHRHHDDSQQQQHEVKNRHGLLATALDTILIEQANILGAPLPSKPPTGDKQSPQHVHEKTDITKRRSSIDAIRKKITHSFQKRLSISEKSTKTANTVATQTDGQTTDERKNSSTKEYVLSAPFLSLNDLELIDANEMNKMSYGSAMEFGSIKEAAQPFISLTDLYTVHDSDNNNCVPMIQPSPPVPPQPSLNPLVENDTNNPMPESNFPYLISINKTEIIHSESASISTNNNNKNNFVDDDDDNDDARCDLLSCTTNKAFLLTPFPNPNNYRTETANVSSPCIKTIGATPNSIGHIRAESTGGKMSQSPAKNIQVATSTPSSTKETVCRRSSDSDLNVTPKGKFILSSSFIYSFIS